MKSRKEIIITLLVLVHPLVLLAQFCSDSSLRVIDTVSFSIQHISDIDFLKQEYKLELWLKFHSNDSCSLIDLENQIAIKDSKKMLVEIIPQWNQNPRVNNKNRSNIFYTKGAYRKELKINCTMIEKWDLDGYPFDKQKLDLTMYNAAYKNKYFKLIPFDTIVNYNAMSNDIIEIENGWAFKRSSAKLENDTILHDPFISFNPSDTVKVYSAIHYSIPLFRENRWSLFFKLLIGMYVAFFVAYISIH